MRFLSKLKAKGIFFAADDANYCLESSRYSEQGIDAFDGRSGRGQGKEWLEYQEVVLNVYTFPKGIVTESLLGFNIYDLAVAL